MTGCGSPDWERIKKAGILSRLGDPAELSSRILSGVSWIRTGDVLYYDDQSRGLGNHILSGAPAGYTEALVTDCWMYGGKSILLTTNAAAGATAEIKYGLPNVGGTRIGFEFNYLLGANAKSLLLELNRLGSGWEKTAYLKYLVSGAHLQYYDEVAGFTDLAAGISQPGIVLPVSYMKLAMDVADNLYIGVWHNGAYYNLSTSPILVGESEAPYLLTGRIALTGDGVGAATVHINKIVVTQNEL